MFWYRASVFVLPPFICKQFWCLALMLRESSFMGLRSRHPQPSNKPFLNEPLVLCQVYLKEQPESLESFTFFLRNSFLSLYVKLKGIALTMKKYYFFFSKLYSWYCAFGQVELFWQIQIHPSGWQMVMSDPSLQRMDFKSPVMVSFTFLQPTHELVCGCTAVETHFMKFPEVVEPILLLWAQPCMLTLFANFTRFSSQGSCTFGVVYHIITEPLLFLSWTGIFFAITPSVT